MDKKRVFNGLLEKIKALRQGREDIRDRFEDICRLLHDEVAYYDWVGFYLVDTHRDHRLVLGPFAGAPTEHRLIPFGQGVCGRAAADRQVIIVDDVTTESNYLSCNIRVRSEMVIPILHGRKLWGVLDIDSHTKAAFKDDDRTFLIEVGQAVSAMLQ